MSEPARPPLSVIVPAREGLEEVAPVLEALVPQAREHRVEVVVIGGPPAPAPAGVRFLPLADANMYELRRRGFREASGALIAIGEDHAIPEPGWCAAVIRAHAERPEVAAIAGRLVDRQRLSQRPLLLRLPADLADAGRAPSPGADGRTLDRAAAVVRRRGRRGSWSPGRGATCR